MRRTDLAVTLAVTLAACAPVASLVAQAPPPAPPAGAARAAVSDPAADAPRFAPAALDAHQRLAREIYRELVEINTVDSVGSTTRAAEAMARRFRAAGFPAADVRVLVPAGKPTKGNLVVRYRGSGGAGAGAKPILLLAHLDVVAANRADWPRDPFVLHEEGGYFLGRGTADDKAMAAMFVANLLRYKQQGWRPARDLVLALTADEEGGDANGVEYLIANHRALIDAAYALNEGGGGVLQEGRPVMHSVQAAEKVPVNFTLTVTNPGGHSSVPRPDNAIYQLADALGRLGRHQFPVALNAVTRPWLTETAKVEGAEVATAMRALAADPADTAAAARLSRDPRYASTLRTSCVATRLAGGHAYNALPQMASANVNCRIVPTSSADEVRAEIARVVADTNVRITLTIPIRERFGAAPSAIEPGLLAAVTDLTHATWGPDVPVVPTMSTGATDGRFLRAAGIPTYGVSGIFSAPGEANAHGRDEKLRVRSFYEGLAFLDRLVRRVAGGQAAM
jgi:acetylornithine deacetylase/succinyl-diaminopimelate desuccinylase-like protein